MNYLAVNVWHVGVTYNLSADVSLVLQELQGQVEQEASTIRTERKKRETAERLCKKAIEDKVQSVHVHRHYDYPRVVGLATGSEVLARVSYLYKPSVTPRHMASRLVPASNIANVV